MAIQILANRLFNLIISLLSFLIFPFLRLLNGGKGMEWISSQLEKFSTMVADELISLLGKGIFSIGSITEQLSIVGIIVGVFAIRFKNTKILRWSVISYLIALVVEILGITLIK